MDWESLKFTFPNRFFPRKCMEAKLVEFINLKKGHFSVKEYALKLTLLSMYSHRLVEYRRDLMNKFMMEVYDLVEEECHMAMLVDYMDISQLIVFFQQIKESKLRK